MKRERKEEGGKGRGKRESKEGGGSYLRREKRERKEGE